MCDVVGVRVQQAGPGALIGAVPAAGGTVVARPRGSHTLYALKRWSSPPALRHCHPWCALNAELMGEVHASFMLNEFGRILGTCRFLLITT